MRITNRDLEIFKLLTKTAILTTAQLNRYVFQNIAPTTVLRRLRALERSKYIQRIAGLPNYEIAWALNLKGAELVGYARPKRHFHPLALTHDVKLSEITLTLEGLGIARSWIPEHEIRSAMARRHGVKKMKSEIVPDGLMGVSYKDEMQSVVVEVELNSKSQKRYEKIFNSYAWKSNSVAVWYFVPTRQLGEHLAKLWLKSIGQKGRWLLWSEISDVNKNGGKAIAHYFDKGIEIEKLFQAKAKDEKPAHAGALEVSTLEDKILDKHSELTSEDRGELPAKAI